MQSLLKTWKKFISDCLSIDKIMYPSIILSEERKNAFEVPVHRTKDSENLIKNTHADGKAVKKHKNVSTTDYKGTLSQEANIADHFEEKRKNLHISKKQLWKDNAQMAKEKEEIIAKFNELEDLSVKKITKLKEKISGLQNDKTEIEYENSNLKVRINDILGDFEEVRNQLEMCKICHGCEEFKAALEKFSRENIQLRKNNGELNEDLSMLKTVVYRLNLQLERYQEKFRNLNNQMENTGNSLNFYHIPDKGNGDNHQPQEFYQEYQDKQYQHNIPTSWGKVNSHTLGPLLEAFQDTINEKDEIINEYEIELNNFTAKYKEILYENENLHKNLTEDDQCSARLREELEKNRKELSNCKEENDVLIKKCCTKQDKIEEILRCYESKVEQLKRDYNVLHEQYYKSRTEVASLNEKNKLLQKTQEELKNEKKDFIPISVHTASVDECKKWYEELKLQYEKEKDKLKQTMDLQSKELADYKSKIFEINQEKQEKEEKIKTLEKHIRKGEAKYIELEQALNESKVARTACKKQLHKAMNFAKDLVTEQETLLRALNQRQKENKVVTAIGADMASKMDNLKSQLKEVQRDAWQELNTVEGKIQEQEKTIEQMKEDYEREVNRLEGIIKRQSDKAVLLKNNNSNLPLSPYLLFRDKIQN